MPVDPPNKRNRLFKNSLYGLFSWLLPILPTMIATPIIIDSLGNEQYGLFVAILGFVTYFFTVGIGKVAAKYVAEYRATGETEKISPVISATILLGVFITLIGSTAVVIFARVIVVNLLLIPENLQNTAVTGLYLACVTIMSIMLGQTFQLALQGLQRFDRYVLLTNLSSITFSIGSLVLVLNGFGVLSLLYWNLFTATAIGLLSFIIAKKLLPEFRFTFQIGGEAWRAVYRYAASIIAYQVFGSILLLFERGWILRKFGAEALTYYAVPMNLAIYLHLFIGSLILALFPVVNELLNNREKLVVLYQKTTKLVLAILTFAVLSVVSGGHLFLEIWLRSENFANASYWLLVIHVLTFTILALSTIAWQIAESFRAAVLNAISTLLWMTISVPLMIILATEWAATGVAVARFVGVLVFIPLIFIVEKRFLDGMYWRFWGFVAVRIALAGILAFGTELFIINGLGRSWLTFILAMSVGAVVYVAGLMLTGFFDEMEKEMFSELLAKFR